LPKRWQRSAASKTLRDAAASDAEQSFPLLALGALEFFTTWKAVYVDYSDKLQRAQIDNAE
jgi:hypothetical protein